MSQTKVSINGVQSFTMDFKHVVIDDVWKDDLLDTMLKIMEVWFQLLPYWRYKSYRWIHYGSIEVTFVHYGA